MAVVITVFTLEKGWLGIWYWIMSVIPHGLCYLAIWLLLSAAVKEKQDLKRVRFWLLVGILVTSVDFGSLGKSLAFRVFIFVEYLLIC